MADGSVLVVGGASTPPLVDGFVVTPSAEEWDPKTGRWLDVASLGAPRRNIDAQLLSDGRVLVAGGLSDANALLATAELYDPASDAWHSTDNLATARAPRLVRLADGSVLAIASTARILSTAVERFQP